MRLLPDGAPRWRAPVGRRLRAPILGWVKGAEPPSRQLWHALGGFRGGGGVLGSSTAFPYRGRYGRCASERTGSMCLAEEARRPDPRGSFPPLAHATMWIYELLWASRQSQNRRRGIDCLRQWQFGAGASHSGVEWGRGKPSLYFFSFSSSPSPLYPPIAVGSLLSGIRRSAVPPSCQLYNNSKKNFF